MLIGVSTENFTSNSTPLSKDIADLYQFNVKGIEIVPKTPMDFREGRALKSSLGQFEYIGVLLAPPVTENSTAVDEISNYYKEAFQFSAEIGAHLVMVRSDFPGCGSPGDVIKFLQPISEQAMRKGLKIALLNWFSQESQCGTYEQVSEIVKTIDGF
jgi:sugar phosphate isomerase/epimerase